MPAVGVVCQFSFQFHATPSEVAALAGRWSNEFDLCLVGEFFGPPYARREAWPTNDPSELPNRLTLRVDPPDLSASNANGLHDADGLSLLVPRLTAEGLTETFISGGSSDPDRLRGWKSAIRRLRKTCHAGARVVSPSGASAAAPAHRHTEGAHALAVKGTPMIAFPGGSLYEFVDL